MLDDLTAAPVPMNIGGKTFEVSPLSQGDFGQLLRMVQFEPWNTLRKVEGVPIEVVNATLAECAKKKLTPTSAEFAEASNLPWVHVETVYLSLKHKHADITREVIEAWGIDEVAVVHGVVHLVSGAFTDPEATSKKVADIRGRFPRMFNG